MRRKEIQRGNFTAQASPNLRDEWDWAIGTPEARSDRAAQFWPKSVISLSVLTFVRPR
jgi:hypothetical protein